MACLLSVPVGIVTAVRFPEYAEASETVDTPGPVFAMNLVLIGMVLVLLAVYQGLCVAMWGATIGKRAMRLRVVRVADGGAVGWSQAAGRAGATLLFSVVPVLGHLDLGWAFRDKPNRQTLHDKLAGTVVVRVDRASPYGPRVHFTG
ncbi:putative RDD family membrane protein YckC [Phytomonospora endophytica]|uniref:Putative RDD family membrane protein YckC n=1 Tax=Phytomonospora endophytica TaxID=714109 RepID=A0A841FCP6_9ACTN|nr:putative RDD family membrane protein YckC [Phytomonospora endophytica]GIG64919.1 hypothetical protein Pen01_12140 [Phytomonospora endophytica]